MKTNKRSLAEVKGKLSREEMKQIIAGTDQEIGNGGGYKCCWVNDMSNCSECIPAARPECIAGAKAVEC